MLGSTIFRFLFVVYLICLHFSAECQQPPKPAFTNAGVADYFTVVRLSSKEGLPQNQVNSITAGENRALLLATTYGVVSYDGFSFKTLTKDYSARKVNFHQLQYVPRYNLLLGKSYGGGMYRILPELSKLENGADDPILNACASGDTLFAISASGKVVTARLPGQKFSAFAHTQIQKSVCLLVQYPYLYIGSTNGVYRLHLQNRRTTKLLDANVVALKVNPYNKQLYVLTPGKVFVQSDSLLIERCNLNPNGQAEENKDIGFTGPEDFFVASRQGLFHFTPKGAIQYGFNNQLPTSHISAVYFDEQENCLFAGTEEKGLLKLHFHNELRYKARGKSQAVSFISVVKTAGGQLLSAENCCEMYSIGTNTLKVYSSYKASFASLALLGDTVCAGTWGNGVVLFRDGITIGAIKVPGLPNNDVHAVYRDSKKRIWVGTSKGIAFGKNVGDIRPLLSDNVKGAVLDIYELRNGDICLACENGVYRLHDTTLGEVIDERRGLLAKEVRSLFEDAEGKLWIGTYGGGIYCYHKGQLRSINAMKNCQLDKDAFCFAQDDAGNLFITSNQGLWRLKQNDLNDFYYGRLHYLVPFRYGEEAGLINPEFNGGFSNSYLEAEPGLFYFPSIEGLVEFSPRSLNRRRIKPQINEVFVNDTLAPEGLTVFGRLTSSVKVNFSCVSFAALYNTYFQHKLVGDKSYDWSLPQKQNSVNLKLLPAGHYTLMVRAIDGFNDRSPAVATFGFEIKPFVHETWWFRVVFLVSLLLVIAIAVRWFTQEQQRRSQLKEQYSRQLAEIELKAIQAQLNPHFLFNCMNTMKHFILEKNYVKANDSLNRISLLLRNSLENSDRFFLRLGEKIKFLTNYIELEKMRLGDTLDYSITFDEGVSKEVIVPNFIYQPYIENAIKHGINHLSGKTGRLNIHFSINSNQLVCAITDNGIGRQASHNLNRNNLLHVSKGTGLTREKASFLKLYNNYECHISIEDLHDEQGNAIGTRVKIITPLTHDSRSN